MSNDSGNSKIEVTGEENTSKEAIEKRIKELSNMLKQVPALDVASQKAVRIEIGELMEKLKKMNNPSK